MVMETGSEGMGDEDMADRRSWHIDKGIPIAVIITVIIMIVTVSRDQSKQDERIALAETNILTLQQARMLDQQRTDKKFDELKTDLRMINSKLDRLIEDRVGER